MPAQEYSKEEREAWDLYMSMAMGQMMGGSLVGTDPFGLKERRRVLMELALVSCGEIMTERRRLFGEKP